MPITPQELGRRLAAARTARRMTQEDVARHLGVSRSTIAQMELGNRAVTSLELSRLADLFGRDIRELLTEEFREEDVLSVLFRAAPEVAESQEAAAALRACLTIGRELTNLERLLGIDRDAGVVAAYPLPMPRGRWEAIQQGTRVAEDERRRIGLGSNPVGDVVQVLESQGVRTGLVDLPLDVSGLTLGDRQVGPFVVVNRQHPVVRRRFSYVHELAHVLLDRERLGTVSRTEERDDFFEVRANAFAASFLMPEQGVRQFVAGLGKGGPSRVLAEVFDENGALRVEGRAEPGSQDIQLYDVVQLAYHFGVSCLAALYRLRNLRLLTEAELERLREQDAAGLSREIAEMLGLPEPEHESPRTEFRRRFLALGIEAFRRGRITRAKLDELADLVGVLHDQVARLLEDSGFEDREEGDVLLPDG